MRREPQCRSHEEQAFGAGRAKCSLPCNCRRIGNTVVMLLSVADASAHVYFFGGEPVVLLSTNESLRRAKWR